MAGVLLLLLLPLHLSHQQPLLPGLLSGLSGLAGGPELLQAVVDGGSTATTVGVNAVQPATVVTTVPAVVEPAMMMPTILPVIFAVAVIKALVLGQSYYTFSQNKPHGAGVFQTE